MRVKKDIKKLLLENDVSITYIAKEMSKYTGKNISRSNISQKLIRGTLKYEEALLIGQILGYDLKFVRINEMLANKII
ncbi:MAG: hypothetical protein LUG16_04875 [Candidatus Gastranaerophilales bacterium]|nr:hypothetical protein [Candidatus Gastranaerophilales bacterium]